jgi:hypothetical protein
MYFALNIIITVSSTSIIVALINVGICFLQTRNYVKYICKKKTLILYIHVVSKIVSIHVNSWKALCCRFFCLLSPVRVQTTTEIICIIQSELEQARTPTTFRVPTLQMV